MNYTAYIVDSFKNVSWHPVSVEKELWDVTADELHSPYGFRPTRLVPNSVDNSKWVRMVEFCPELITEHVQGETESVALEYIDSLLNHITYHYLHPEIPDAELEPNIELVHWMIAPEGYQDILRIRNKIQSATHVVH